MTSVPLEELGVVVSSSSASGELTSEDRVNVSGSSSDSVLVCVVISGEDEEALLVISIPLEVLDDVGVDVVASSSSACGELTSEERVNVSGSSSDTVLVCVVISGDDDDVSSEALLEISPTLEELDKVGVIVVVSSSSTSGELSSVESVNVSVSSTDALPVCKVVLLS